MEGATRPNSREEGFSGKPSSVCSLSLRRRSSGPNHWKRVRFQRAGDSAGVGEVDEKSLEPGLGTSCPDPAQRVTSQQGHWSLEEWDMGRESYPPPGGVSSSEVAPPPVAESKPPWASRSLHYVWSVVFLHFNGIWWHCLLTQWLLCSRQPRDLWRNHPIKASWQPCNVSFIVSFIFIAEGTESQGT